MPENLTPPRPTGSRLRTLSGGFSRGLGRLKSQSNLRDSDTVDAAPAASADGAKQSQAAQSGTATPDSRIPASAAPTVGVPTRPRPGHPGNLSTAQAAALRTFEEQLRSVGALPSGYDDAEEGERLWGQVALTRFLRARQWSVSGAVEMYQATQQWRASVSLPSLVDPSSPGYFDFHEVEAVARAGWSMYFHGIDKLGRPIFVQGLAGLDTTKLLQATTQERITLNFACTLETACQSRYRAATLARRAKGDTEALIDDNFMIVDIGGLGMGTFWAFKTQLQGLLACLDANFPELSGRVQIINAPWLFSSIWSYLKGWLPVGTVDKIDIQGADYAATLLQYIEPSELPAALGGSCKCPGSCTRSDAGPWQHALKANATAALPADAQPRQPSPSLASSETDAGTKHADPQPSSGVHVEDGSGLQPNGGPKGDPAPPAEAPVAIEVTAPKS